MNQVILTILDSQNLCKLVKYGTATPIAEPDIKNKDKHSLLFDHIYPMPVIPKVEDKAKTIITIVLDDFKPIQGNSAYKTSKIIFNILMHIDLWAITVGSENQLRPYSIISELDTLFNEQRIATIGKLKFGTCRWIATNEKWHGYELTYNVTEFN